METSFPLRVGAAITFLAIASSVELRVRGRAAVRWRASLVICSAGLAGALLGLGLALISSSISPAYFAIAKGLGWSPGLQGRACWLGAQAGSQLGAVAGCALVHANCRKGPRSLAWPHVVRKAWVPLLASVSCGLLVGCFGASGLPSTIRLTLNGDVPVADAHAFLVAWAIHAGAYAGAVSGICVAAWRTWHARHSA